MEHTDYEEKEKNILYGGPPDFIDTDSRIQVSSPLAQTPRTPHTKAHYARPRISRTLR